MIRGVKSSVDSTDGPVIIIAVIDRSWQGFMVHYGRRRPLCIEKSTRPKVRRPDQTPQLNQKMKEIGVSILPLEPLEGVCREGCCHVKIA